MGGAVLSFGAMAIAARQLLPHMGTFEILFFRAAVMFLIVTGIALRQGLASVRTKVPGLHLWRNLFHLSGQASWVVALSLLPLATVFAIEFTMAIFTAVLAVVFLGERMTPPRLLMLALGFSGVMVILRPGFAGVQPGALVMLFGAFCFAVQMIQTKRLVATEGPTAVLFWMALIQAPVCLVLALPDWRAPVAADVPWMLFIGLGSYTAHYCLTRAMKIADAVVVAPVDFFRLPLIAVVGYLFYDEPFDPAVLLGAFLIFIGTYVSLRMERKA